MEIYRVVVNDTDHDHGLGELRHQMAFECWYDRRGLRHRENGPAVIARRPGESEIAGEAWYHNGVQHRDGLEPAVTINHGFYRQYEWYKDGNLHRVGGPAYLRTTAEGFPRTVIEYWHENGELHRIGGPAVIMANGLTGIINYEEWLENGAAHRVDGPAIITRDERTGIVIEEEWRRKGAPYRIDGPCSIERDSKTGHIVQQEFSGSNRPPSPAP